MSGTVNKVIDQAKSRCLDPSELPKLLRVEPESGKLFWLHRHDGTPQVNAKLAGKEAFTSLDSSGYRIGTLRGKNYRAHRVIWAIVHGEWPNVIDHIDGDCANNAISNLRNVNQSENMRNASLSARNKSGSVGVYFDASRRRWVASIKGEHRKQHLGRFKCKTAAVLARKSAEIAHGFHTNHGRA